VLTQPPSTTAKHNKHSWKISLETLLNSVSCELLPFIGRAKSWQSYTARWLYDKRPDHVESSQRFTLNIHVVRKSCRNHFGILSLMNFFPLLSDKVMIVLHCWVSRMWCYFSIVSSPFIWCAQGTDRRHSEANLSEVLKY
jgi:hypothetical protein